MVSFILYLRFEMSNGHAKWRFEEIVKMILGEYMQPKHITETQPNISLKTVSCGFVFFLN